MGFDSPSHAQSHEHAHYSANHAHGHVIPERLSSRRDFLRSPMGTTLAGASMVELAWHRAAWARRSAGLAHFGAPAPLQVWVNWNIADIDKNLDRA